MLDPQRLAARAAAERMAETVGYRVRGESRVGLKVPVDYGEDVPEISVRLQEMFGALEHLRIGGCDVKVTLLSPTGRPIQITRDLPGFWAGSYADVHKDMRVRYHKHPWPEDPSEAAPALRAKPWKG